MYNTCTVTLLISFKVNIIFVQMIITCFEYLDDDLMSQLCLVFSNGVSKAHIALHVVIIRYYVMFYVCVNIYMYILVFTSSMHYFVCRYIFIACLYTSSSRV